MKVIELLNKIANKDLDIPDYIEFFDRETSKTNKMMVCEENIIYYMDRGALFLNDEVEIIEEHKIPEKLESYISCGWAGTCKDLKREDLFNDLKKMGSKINEILDYLEELK